MNSKEERIDIGRRLYTHEISLEDTASTYWVPRDFYNSKRQVY